MLTRNCIVAPQLHCCPQLQLRATAPRTASCTIPGKRNSGHPIVIAVQGSGFHLAFALKSMAIGIGSSQKSVIQTNFQKYPAHQTKPTPPHKTNQISSPSPLPQFFTPVDRRLGYIYGVNSPIRCTHQFLSIQKQPHHDLPHCLHHPSHHLFIPDLPEGRQT